MSPSELLQNDREKLAYLAGVIDGVLDLYVRDRADADCQGDPPRFIPNVWMQVQTDLEDALRRVGMEQPNV